MTWQDMGILASHGHKPTADCANDAADSGGAMFLFLLSAHGTLIEKANRPETLLTQSAGHLRKNPSHLKSNLNHDSGTERR